MASQIITSLTMDQAIEKAPAIVATSKAPYVKGDDYIFTPSTQIIENMEQLGFCLTNAKQAKSTNPLRTDYGNHIMTFQNPSLYLKDSKNEIESFPTIVVMNSHDGTKKLQFEMGLFRLVCTNGLIIKSQDFGGFKQKHLKYTLEDLKLLIDQKVVELEKVSTKVKKWSSIELPTMNTRKFAEEAFSTRFGLDRKPTEEELNSLILAKRGLDSQNTLWHTYNTLQENLIKGFEVGSKTVRPIKNHIADFMINQALWELTEKVELELA